MSPLVYFDTDFFHHFASAFENRALEDDLRDKILLSPMTMKEVFSHLAVEWGPQVHRQINGLPNWLNSRNIGLLPWMTDAVAKIARVAHPLRSLQRVGIPGCRSLGLSPSPLYDSRGTRTSQDKSKSYVGRVRECPTLSQKARKDGPPGFAIPPHARRISSSMRCRRMRLARVWYPLPGFFSQAMTSASRRRETACFTGR